MRIFNMSGPIAVAALLAAVIVPGAAFAADRTTNPEAIAMQGSKVTLTQAIATAEQQTGGQAYDAGVAVVSGQTRISVETNGPKGVQTVTIDAHSGLVVGILAGGEED